MKYWITFNEPYSTCLFGYEIGVHAPGRVDKNGTNAYMCSYNIIKAHAAAYHVYNNTYRDTQQGTYNVTLGIRGEVMTPTV